MTKIVRANTPAHFIALIPTLAGFVPRNSVCIVPFKGGRTIAVLRFDLPRIGFGLGHAVVGSLSRFTEADGYAIVAFADEDFHPNGGGPTSVLDSIAESMKRAGLTLKDVLAVGPNYYHSRLDPLHEVFASTDIQAAADELGLPAVLKAPDDLADLDLTGFDVKHIRDLMRQIEDGGEYWEEHFEEALRCVHDGTHTNLDIARIGVGMRATTYRDMLIPGIALGEPDAHHKRVMELLLGDQVRVPEVDALERGRVVMRLIRDASESDFLESTALTLGGWFAWALGRGSQAGALLDEAVKIDKANTFAALLIGLIGTGKIPAWAATATNKAMREAATA